MKSQRPEPYRSDTQALQAAAVVAESIVALELAAQILQFTGGADLETVHERFVGLSRF
jgi:chorismate synthase